MEAGSEQDTRARQAACRPHARPGQPTQPVPAGGGIAAAPGTADGATGPAGASFPAAGSLAPPGSFTTAGGTTGTISSLRGQPALVWLVTTWCPGCQAGTAAMPGDLARLRARGIEVVELEDYADLGRPGPGIAGFGRQFAGAAYLSPGWVFGTASQALTQAYNPRATWTSTTWWTPPATSSTSTPPPPPP